MATYDQVNAWNTTRPRSEGYYQYDGESGEYQFIGPDGNVGPDPSANPIESYLKQFYDAASDTYNIPGVGVVNVAAPWATFQNSAAHGVGSDPAAYRANMFEGGGQVIDTPAGQVFVGKSRQDAPEMSAEPGAGFGGLLPMILAGGIGAAANAAGFGLGGLGSTGGAAAGTGAAAGDFASSFLPTLTEGGLATGGGLLSGGTGATSGLIPTLGEIAGTSSLGLPAGGLEAILGGTGVTIPGPLGDIALDAAGNTVGYAFSGSPPTMPTPNAAPAGTQAPAPVQSLDPATTAGTMNPATTGGTAASTLSKFLKDNLGIDLDPSTISMLGTGLGTLLGAYGSNQQAKSLTDIANQARGDRLPALNAFNGALANPDSWYQSAPAMGAVDSVLRKLSANVGNPALNPGALSQAAAYNLGGYNDYLRTTGNLGLSGQDSTIRAQTNAAMGDTNLYNAIGSGIGSLTSNQPNVNGLLEQLLKRNNFGLA